MKFSLQQVLKRTTVPSPLNDEHRQKRLVPWLALSLVIITFVSFSSIFRNDFVDYDDKKFIYGNRHINELNGNSLIYIFKDHGFSPWYKPLVYLSWAIEKHLFGFNPVAFHTTNLLFHLANTLLLFLLLLKLLSKMDPRNVFIPWIAFLVAALFGIGPLKVESVAWAVERKDVMFGFFFLASLWCYVQYLANNKYLYIIIGSLLFLLGILSKSMIITLPFVLFIIDFLMRRKLQFRLFSEKIPYFIILLIGLGLYGVFWSPPETVMALNPGEAGRKHEITNKSFPNATTYVANKAAFQSYRLLQWSFRTVVPEKLSVVYALPAFYYPARFKMIYLLWVVPVLMIIGAGFYFINRNRFIPAGLIFFFMTIITVMGMDINESYASDRYTYIPSIGIFLVLGGIVMQLLQHREKIKYVLILVFTGYLIYFGISTFQRVKTWHDSISLFEDVTTKYPNLYFGYTSLGNSYLELGKPERAIMYFNKSYELNKGQGLMLNARGLAKYNTGDYTGAVNDYDMAIRLEPTFSLAFNNRGNAKQSLGRYNDALQDYDQAVRLDPYYAAAYNGRGMVWQRLANYQKSVEDFANCLKLNPYYYTAYNNRGNSRALMKDFKGAVDDFNLSLIVKPDNFNALHGRGFARLNLGDYNGALDDFNKAIRIDPGYSLAYYNRGLTKIKIGDRSGACDDWHQADRLGYSKAAGEISEYCR
jgi:tetratricopeptide (TPR) repeat protein